MPKLIKPLSHTQICHAKPKLKEYLLCDGHGLHLRIHPNGRKIWLFNYKKPTTHRRTNISLGHFPTVTLQYARQLRDQYRQLLTQGVDPANRPAKVSFGRLCYQWYEHRRTRAHFSPSYGRNVLRLIEQHILPKLGDHHIAQIQTSDLVAVLAYHHSKAQLSSLHRLIYLLTQIFDHGIHLGICQSNPATRLRHLYDRPKHTHRPTIEPETLPKFLLSLSTANIQRQTYFVILWQLLTLSRPVESAHAHWQDIDRNKRLWRYPIYKGNRSESHRYHTVTLSHQALAILDALPTNTGYLFASTRHPNTPMNAQSANAAIKRMGYHGKLVAHGLRSIASTYLNEQGHNSEIIEIALSHLNQDRIKTAYDRGERLTQRFALLQIWADYVEHCATLVGVQLMHPQLRLTAKHRRS